jgi:hypothetical protein
MSAPDPQDLAARLDRLERRVSGLRLWVVLAGLLAAGAGLLSCCGLGAAVVARCPLPVTPTGTPVAADTPLGVGERVVAEWQGSWWDAEVLTTYPDGTVRVHYTGWSPTWDETVHRGRIRLPAR